jgi:spoIIIJ-associated protein
MEAFEFEGKTTEDAINNACHELNLPRDEMDIEIMEPGSAGVFGIVGGRKAKIKVTISKDMPDLADDEDVLAAAKDTLENILALIPVKGSTVRAEQTEGAIILNIDGDKSGLLIGRKGRTLDALQFIVNRIANKSLKNKVQIVIDAENYRQRRRDFLIQMALRIGDKARKAGKPMATNLLNPHDRRIVHLALKEDEKLDTKSRGEGALKKVLIIPRKENSTKSLRE